MYGLSSEDLDLQARARAFADELIPHEEQAELNQGQLPPDLTADAARSSRCWSRNRWAA
jgi:acyl-CoA dehydrogenase